jgi:hypothetical protein
MSITRTSITADTDSYVANSVLVDTNFGGDIDVFVGFTFAKSGSITRRALVRVDVRSIPTSDIIILGTLKGRVDLVSGSEVGRLVQALDVDNSVEPTKWAELEATWNNRTSALPWASPGGDFFAGVLGSATPPAAGDVGTDWDLVLTNGIVNARENGLNRFDFLLKLASEASPSYAFSVDSREGSNPLAVEIIHYSPTRGADGLLLLAGHVGGGTELADLVEVKHAHTIGSISGVVPLVAGGRNRLTDGSASIRSTGSTGRRLSWRAPGSSSYGLDVDIPTDGIYTLCDGDDLTRCIRVEVHGDHVRETGSSASVNIADVLNNTIGGDNVTAADATAGTTDTIPLTAFNQSRHTAHRVKVWLVENAANLELSLDDIAYFSPTSETDPNVIDLAATLPRGSTAELYLRRTVSAGSTFDAGILSSIRFGWDGL